MKKLDNYIEEYNKIKNILIEEKLDLKHKNIIEYINRSIEQVQNYKEGNTDNLSVALNNLMNSFEGLHSILFHDKNNYN